ncbi:MAG TPA: xanthine dehydrogenase family protein molybdopterin-binding subunit [Thermoleophilaceae bacterium]|nr:xanthine dehydrogenase family protein molybdopterin-binding subunit [Thermoleophilaceae bacterium]
MEASPRYVGQSLPRVEDRSLLTGQGSFVDDIERPGQLYARVVRSQLASGRITAVHADAARGRPGIATVITAEDLPPGLRIPIRLAPSEEAKRALQPFLASDVVRYVGEPLAVVVGETPYVVEDAAAEVWAEMEELPPLADAVDAAADDARPLHEQAGTNVVHTQTVALGEDVDALFERADVVVREQFTVHRHSAIPLETRGLVAEFDPGDGSLTVWGPTKVKHYNRRVIAELLGLPLERVRFVEPDVGGGFGTRGEIYPEDLLVPWLAMATGRPVKWVEDRQEHFIAINHSREQRCHMEVAATADGRLLAFRATAWVDLGAYVRTNGPVLVLNTATHLPGPYRWHAFEARALGVLTNKTPAGTYRGPGQYEAALHRERILDVVARRLELDPYELRRRNLVPREEMPYRLEVRGMDDPIVYDSGDFPLLWERLGQDAERSERIERGAGKRLTGVGTAAFVEAGGRGPYEWARVVPDAGGDFTIHVGIAALGQGIATALSQIAADELGVPIARVKVKHHDTDEISEGAGAFSSRSVVFGGNAVVGAVRDLVEAAHAAGAEALGTDPDGVEVVAGGIVRLKGSPERALSFAELGCEGNHRYEKHSRSFSMGGALAVVEVDAETGAVLVRRCRVVCDVGRAINPMLVRGQLVGAAAQGIGGALLEELAYNEIGQPLVTSFMDYCMPTAAELPEIEAVVLELPQHDPSSANGLGAKGAGEVGIIGIGAAVANAVADAIGGDALFSELPITPERVQRWISTRGQEEAG